MAGMAIAMIVDAKRGILARVQIRSFQPTDRPNCEHLNMSGRVGKIGLSWNTTFRKQPSSRDCDSFSHRVGDPVVWVNPAQPPSVSRCAPRSRSLCR